jgi:hypothetical protein
VNKLQKAYSKVRYFIPAVALAAMSGSAHAVDDPLFTAVNAELGTLKVGAAATLALAILIPVGFKVFGIAKRALGKA